MPLASYQTSVPVTVDDAKCIADKGCTVCVDVCPLDVLRISDMTGKAFMAMTNAGTACRAKPTVRPARSRSTSLSAQVSHG